MVKRISWSPAARVAVGLVSLMVSLLLLADVFIGFLPDRVEQARQLRGMTCRALADQLVLKVRSGGDGLQLLLTQAMRDDPSIVGASIRDRDEQVIAATGADKRLHAPGFAARSTLDDVRMTVRLGGQVWGELQVLFRPVMPTTAGGWLQDRMLQGLAVITLLGLVVFYLYLRRMLRYLDPNSSVPERVRTAFDTLSEGVMVVDRDGCVVLTNKAFQKLGPASQRSPVGLDAGTMDWLVRAMPAQGQLLPWAQAMREGTPRLGERVRIESVDAGVRELVMNCAPITEGARRVRGCLTTFSDVTELHERTESLRVALAQLHASQAEIESKNEELTRLATRDPLTGCLNRRSLMALAGEAFGKAMRAKSSMAVMMCDIDHFKSVNDRFGHGGGDQVIQAAAEALGRSLRSGDLLGRYGGEEFCIVLPGASVTDASAIAERLRADVEANVGAALRDHPGVRVTMSFGLAQISASSAGLDELIDLADKALYRSKKSGRNRVSVWDGVEVEASG